MQSPRLNVLAMGFLVRNGRKFCHLRQISWTPGEGYRQYPANSSARMSSFSMPISRSIVRNPFTILGGPAM